MVLKYKFSSYFLRRKSTYRQIFVLLWLNLRDKNNLQVSVGFYFSGLWKCIGQNYVCEKYCKILLNSGLNDIWGIRKPKCTKNGLFWALLIFAHTCYTKINGAQKLMGLMIRNLDLSEKLGKLVIQEDKFQRFFAN